jgi:hypothetical protein
MTDPFTHLKFFWDGEAKLASVYGLGARGEEVSRTFDLNGLRGRKELVRARSEHTWKLLVLLKFAQGGDQDALTILRDACRPNAPYSAFALAYIAPYL